MREIHEPIHKGTESEPRGVGQLVMHLPTSEAKVQSLNRCS